MSDGRERPIGYSSRTLNPSERNYSQLEKEGFFVHLRNQENFGRPFDLVTNHKLLLGLLKERRPVSLKRLHESRGGWSCYWVSWRNDVQYPLKSLHELRWSLFLSTYEYTLLFWKTGAHGNADALHYQKNNGDSELQPYSSRRLELSSYEGCLMWGTRVVIPPPGRVALLQELH